MVRCLNEAACRQGLITKQNKTQLPKLLLREQQLTGGGYETGQATPATTGRQLRLLQ